MAIRFKRVQRLCDPTNKEAGKKVYPVISYQYDTSATLDEFAKEISSTSGVSEGETISVLKDFRTLLRKTLLSGRSVNSFKSNCHNTSCEFGYPSLYGNFNAFGWIEV